MKKDNNIALILFTLACSLNAFGCKSLPPVVSEGGAAVVDCAKESVTEIAKDHLLDIEGSLLQDNWKNSLTNDAIKIGKDAVACLVDFIVNRAKQDAPRAQSDKNTRTKIERGEEWLQGERVTFRAKLQ